MKLDFSDCACAVHVLGVLNYSITLLLVFPGISNSENV